MARLTLDGLHLDLHRPEGPWRTDLTWRGWVTQCPAYIGAALVMAKVADATDMPISREHGLAESELAI